MATQDNLGDRCKKYESTFENYFLRKTPIIVRVDGKGFSKWTKGCARPYDQSLIDTMFKSAKEVASSMQGCKALYAQSDEVTFLLLDDGDDNTQQWFGGRQNKIESITSAMMTAFFNKNWFGENPTSTKNPAIFDARAFQCPREDVSNVFLWRAKDWQRNSLNMYCMQHFSHKELQGKNKDDRHNMLAAIDKRWSDDVTPQQKFGSFWTLAGDHLNVEPTYDSINSIIFP
jgi:tRNA(His) guanylyltransferase